MSGTAISEETVSDQAHSGLRDLALLKKLWPFVKPHWGELLASVLLLPLVTLTQMAQPFIVKHAIDTALPHGEFTGDTARLLWISGVFLLVLLAHYWVRYQQMLMSQRVGQKIIKDIRLALYTHLQSLSLSFFHKHPVGRLMTRVTSDVENLSEMLSSGGLAILQDLAIIAGGVLGMLLMDWQLALIAIVMLLLNLVVMEFFRVKTRQVYDDIRTKLPRITAFLNENILGMELIQLYRREALNFKQFDDLNESYFQSRKKSVFYSLSFNSVVELLTILTQAAVLWVAGMAILQGNMTFGLLGAFFMLVTMAFEPIENVSEKITIIQSGLSSIDKVMGLLKEEPEITSPLHPTSFPSPLKGELIFDGVRFGYRPDLPIIQDMHFTVKAGETLALVGPSGAGKTTLIKLLMRFYDIQAGSIRLDGVDIRALDLTMLRRHMVSIQQDDILFSRSVAENITLTPGLFSAMQEGDQKRLMDAVREVNALSIVNRLPAQFDEVLLERGKNLSVGERQLILFARAVYHNPCILILDEATSAVDSKTEGLVQEALQRLMQPKKEQAQDLENHRTVITIAHRLSTIEAADQILLIDQGQILEQGSHAQLMTQKGRYAEFYNYQLAQQN